MGDRVRRLLEAAHLIFCHTTGGASRRALLSCYRELLRTTCCSDEVHLTLRIRRERFPLTMRKSDVFTLAEVLHERQYALRSTLPARPVIVDAGANVGITPIWFLANYPGAEVHCFEPEGENFRLLSENLAGIGGVHLIRAALGAEAGHVDLHLAEHGAMHSVVDAGPASETQRVPLVRLDRYLGDAGIGVVDLLKMDVEGSDLDLLRGLGSRLDDVRVIAGEMHEAIVSPREFYGHLDRHGFRILQKRYFAGARDAGVHMFEAART